MCMDISEYELVHGHAVIVEWSRMCEPTREPCANVCVSWVGVQMCVSSVNVSCVSTCVN